MKALVCIDVQNDFVLGDLGSPKAQELAPKIIAFAKECRAKGYAIYATADTHSEKDWDPERGSLKTLEASLIPKHCIEGTWGHKIVDGLVKDENGYVIIPQGHIVDKPSFGSEGLCNKLAFDFGTGADAGGYLGEQLDEILVCGFVTNICVVSNVLMLRAQFPNVPIRVLADLCAGTSEAMHGEALDVMRSCLVTVVDANGQR